MAVESGCLLYQGKLPSLPAAHLLTCLISAIVRGRLHQCRLSGTRWSALYVRSGQVIGMCRCNFATTGMVRACDQFAGSVFWPVAVQRAGFAWERDCEVHARVCMLQFKERVSPVI
eukprot:4032394-Pleurochrysis_carterae.AAC.1